MDAGVRRTLAIYSTLMKQLLSACHDSESRKLVLILEKIHQSMVKRRLQQQVSAQPEVQTTSTEAKHRHLEKEMRLVKSCLPIGGMEGREFFTTPILNQSQPLLDKSKVSKALETLYECDPYLPQDLPVLMVPFRGSGFFEFDNNTLIVPISPTFPAEEVVFRASANYRLLTDQLQHKGEIKRNYEKLFDGNRFKENFLKDYVQWMTRISKGHRKIMPLKKFDFFSSYIGPDPKSLLASPEIKFMPKPQLRRQLNELMGGETSQAGYIRIATIYWHLDDKAKALKYAEEALTAGMPNPKLLLIYGYTLKARGDAKKAQQMFKNCQRLYKNSLWGAYAQRELES
jgi:tetratricopeptide (TPR) repeat protein